MGDRKLNVNENETTVKKRDSFKTLIAWFKFSACTFIDIK